MEFDSSRPVAGVRVVSTLGDSILDSAITGTDGNAALYVGQGATITLFSRGSDGRFRMRSIPGILPSTTTNVLHRFSPASLPSPTPTPSPLAFLNLKVVAAAGEDSAVASIGACAASTVPFGQQTVLPVFPSCLQSDGTVTVQVFGWDSTSPDQFHPVSYAQELDVAAAPTSLSLALSESFDSVPTHILLPASTLTTGFFGVNGNGRFERKGNSLGELWPSSYGIQGTALNATMIGFGQAGADALEGELSLGLDAASNDSQQPVIFGGMARLRQPNVASFVVDLRPPEFAPFGPVVSVVDPASDRPSVIWAFTSGRAVAIRTGLQWSNFVENGVMPDPDHFWVTVSPSADSSGSARLPPIPECLAEFRFSSESSIGGVQFVDASFLGPAPSRADFFDDYGRGPDVVPFGVAKYSFAFVYATTNTNSLPFPHFDE